jgi:hypothetical protein
MCGHGPVSPLPDEPSFEEFTIAVELDSGLGAEVVEWGLDDRRLEESGMAVIVRLSAYLLVCIGVQIMWSGVSALLLSLPLRVR